MVFMRCKANESVMMTFTKNVGDFGESAKLIMVALDCSYSKAEKLARGDYPFSLNPFEQRELSKLTKRPMEELFPALNRKGKPKAS